MSQSVWEIDLLGPLRARRDERLVSHFRTHKTGALLACLALDSGRQWRRDALIEELWPGLEQEPGRNNLRIALTALRREFEQGDKRGSFLEADRIQVRLNPLAFTTDKEQFDRMIVRAAHDEEDDRRIDGLSQAVALYRSDLLPGYDEPWLAGDRQRLADAYLDALRHLIQLLVRRNEFSTALDYARMAVQADPLREQSHRALIQLYAAMGRPGAALRQYQELTQLLHEELRTEPSAITRDLVARFAGQAEGETEIPRGRTAATTVIAQSHFSSPSPRSGGAGLILTRPSSLPQQLTQFFGREENLTEIVEMLGSPETRLVTLTGMGGSGKTRLALTLAERLEDRFDGAVWFVPLANLNDPDRIIDAIFDSLHLSRQTGASVTNQVVGSLRCGPSLLILDNLEHLAVAGGKLIASLLAQVPLLTCLITSRHRLNLTGEHEYAVLPLSTPHAAGSPERMMEFASVQLFVDRARAVRPTFEITSENAAAIGELCRHLEGVPLAIELAAAYAPVMTPSRILSRLTPRLPLLVNRLQDAPARHASLRATLQWSYQLLDPPVQSLLTHLSLFRGGWTLEAVEAIFGGKLSKVVSDMAYSESETEPREIEPRSLDVLEGLMLLRERSLITTEERGGEMRFFMLETVREFAAEQWRCAEEEQAAYGAFVEYAIRFAEEADFNLSGRDAFLFLNRMEMEHDNLCAALERCGTSSNRLLRLASAMALFWHMRGYLEEGLKWLEGALCLCFEEPTLTCRRACKGAGNLAYACSDYPAARRYFERYLDLSEQAGDERGRATALGSLGNIARDLGDLEEAQRLLSASFLLFDRLGDARGRMLSQANLAYVATHRRDYVSARTLIEEALTGFRTAEDVPNIQLGLNNLASTLLQMEEVEPIAPMLAESLTLTRALQNRSGAVQTLRLCARLAEIRQEPARVALLFGSTETLAERFHIGMPPGAMEDYQHTRDRILRTLGEAEFLLNWERGQRHSLDQAIGYALEWLQPDLYGFWPDLNTIE